MNNWRNKKKYKDAIKKLSSKLIIYKSRNNSNSNSKQVRNNYNQTETSNENLWEKQKETERVTFSDKVNLGGVIVNTFIAGFTLYALYLTNQSLKISKDSLEFAKKTSKDADSTSKVNFDLTKQSVQAAIKLSQFADSNYIITKKGIENSNINYEKSFKISEKSFNETINQFNKSNTPFVQIEDVKIEEAKENTPFFITYKIGNITNIPVKIIKQRAYYKINNMPITQDEINSKKYEYPQGVNQYLIKDNFIINKATFFENLKGKDFIEYINKKENYIFLYRDIVYENLVTKKIRHYVFHIKVKKINSNTVANNTFVEFIYNENFDE